MRNQNSSIALAAPNDRIGALNMALASGETLDDESLLEVILARHIGTNAPAAAQCLMQRFSHLDQILDCELETLMEVECVTLGAAAAILQMRHLAKAVNRARITNCVLLDSNKRVFDYCRGLFANIRREEFHALFLNRRGELQGEKCLQQGTIDHVCVYPRELLKHAIRHHASYIILVHNHPFGRARPSKADICMTRELEKLVGAIGASVFDHIIISPDDVFSFRENALLSVHTAQLHRDTV